MNANAQREAAFLFRATAAWWLLWLGVMIAGAVGYILNAIEVAQACCEPMTGVLVLRFVGLFILPLGGIMGYI